jgi:oxygen-independent coproporphyrinogen-3 oxidase
MAPQTGAAEFAVYVHVPFCHVQCPYCTFFTVPRPEAAARMRPFLAALGREWAARVRPRLGRGDRLATLYWGGGTPSDLPAADLTACLQDWAGDLPGGLAGLDEATVECNPETATPALLDGLRSAGVGRISLGVQGLDDHDLRVLGRAATAAQNRAALAAVAARFPSWNADLILGIPGSPRPRLEAALEELVEAGAPHLSFYCLEMPPERARRLGDAMTPDTEAAKADLYEFTSAWVEGRGFEHYEISNAARPGHRAVHNTAYWEGREYVGLGPGAHSFEAGVRRANRPDLRAWQAALEAGADPPASHEVLTPDMRRHERLLLGLRQSRGLERHDSLLAGCAGLVDELERRGLAHRGGPRVRLTPRGWLVSDAVVLQILAA